MSEEKKASLIYRNTQVYRAAMNTLYAGKYRARFRRLIPFLGGTREVLELCFGDIIFAGMCQRKGIAWRGIDISESFVRKAKKKNLDALCMNIRNIDQLPESACIVMAGSLYHFYEDTESLFAKMLKASPRIILSEPVKNIASRKDMVGRLAAVCSGTGEGKQNFRYNQETLTEEVKKLSERFNFAWKIHPAGRDCIVTIIRNGN